MAETTAPEIAALRRSPLHDLREEMAQAELKGTNQIAASLFFAKVFGSGSAARGLNLLVSLSSFGNLIAVLIGQSRIVREIGR